MKLVTGPIVCSAALVMGLSGVGQAWAGPILPRNATAPVQVANNSNLRTLAEALITAGSYAVPGSEFLTVLGSADLIAITALKVYLYRERIRVFERSLDDPNNGAIDKQLKVIDDLMSKAQDSEAAKRNLHKNQGEDPFFGNFVIDDVALRLPTTVGEIVTGTATLADGESAWVPPAVWKKESFRQSLTGSLSFSAELLPSNDLQITLQDLALTGPTEPLNLPGISETGLNITNFQNGTIIARRQADGVYRLQFSAVGTLTNALYPAADPAVDLANVVGYIIADADGDNLIVKVTSDDTLIVPWPVPANLDPILYTAAQTIFDPTARAISFLNALDGNPGAPVVAAHLEGGTFASIFNGYSHPLMESKYFIDPMSITHEDDDYFFFADTPFRINDGTSDLVAGTFADILLDRTTGDFTSKVTNLVLNSDDSLLKLLFVDKKATYQFMSPVNALYFAGLTEDFSPTLADPVSHPHITLVNHNAPEPATASVLALAAMAWITSQRRRRRANEPRHS